MELEFLQLKMSDMLSKRRINQLLITYREFILVYGQDNLSEETKSTIHVVSYKKDYAITF